MPNKDLWARSNKAHGLIMLMNDSDAAAELYFKNYGRCPRDWFRSTEPSQKRKTKMQINDGAGAVCKVFADAEQPTSYALKYDTKGVRLSRAWAAKQNIFNPDALNEGMKEVKRLFPGALYVVRFEVGLENQLHMHVLTDRAKALPSLSSAKRVAEPIYNLEGILNYNNNSALLWTIPNYALYHAATRAARAQGKKLPRTRRHNVPPRPRKPDVEL